MIATVQPFLNELDLLEIKFESLKNTVDVHIVLESPITFSGINKPLHFWENRERFKKYPVHHVVLSEVPGGNDPWAREGAHRRALVEAVNIVGADIVLWGDADEIATSDIVDRFLALRKPMANLSMNMMRFYFNRVDPTSWDYHRILKWSGKEPPRGDWSLPMLTGAGWHFEFTGPKAHLLEKVNSTSHFHEVGTRDFYQRVWRGERPGLEGCTAYSEDCLPAYIRENRERFKDYFA